MGVRVLILINSCLEWFLCGLLSLWKSLGCRAGVSHHVWWHSWELCQYWLWLKTNAYIGIFWAVLNNLVETWDTFGFNVHMMCQYTVCCSCATEHTSDHTSQKWWLWARGNGRLTYSTKEGNTALKLDFRIHKGGTFFSGPSETTDNSCWHLTCMLYELWHTCKLNWKIKIVHFFFIRKRTACNNPDVYSQISLFYKSKYDWLWERTK